MPFNTTNGIKPFVQGIDSAADILTGAFADSRDMGRSRFFFGTGTKWTTKERGPDGIAW